VTIGTEFNGIEFENQLDYHNTNDLASQFEFSEEGGLGNSGD
jgi:hypothetical protein